MARVLLLHVLLLVNLLLMVAIIIITIVNLWFPTVDRNVSSCSREMRPGSNNGWHLKPACLLSLLDVWEESLRCPLGTTIREGVGQAVSYCVCHVSAHCESLRGCFDASSTEYRDSSKVSFFLTGGVSSYPGTSFTLTKKKKYWRLPL